jgi:hypothetical protein
VRKIAQSTEAGKQDNLKETASHRSYNFVWNMRLARERCRFLSDRHATLVYYSPAEFVRSKESRKRYECSGCVWGTGPLLAEWSRDNVNNSKRDNTL